MGQDIFFYVVGLVAAPAGGTFALALVETGPGGSIAVIRQTAPAPLPAME